MLAMWLAILMACLVPHGTSHMLPAVLMRPNNMIEVETLEKVSDGQVAPASLILLMIEEIEIPQVSGGEEVPASPIAAAVVEDSFFPARIMSWIPSGGMCAMDTVYKAVEISSTPTANFPILVTVPEDNDCDKSVMGHYACQALFLLMAIKVVALIMYYKKEFVYRRIR